MSLILSLVLEHVDMSTLLDCVFLSKHVHTVVMRILNYEISLIRELKTLFDGDIYSGIICYAGDSRWVYLGDSEFSKKYRPLRKNIKSNLMTVYVRLYPFDVVTTLDYSKDYRHKEMKQFMDDFGCLVDKYYHKMSLDLIGIIFACACRRCLHCNISELRKYDEKKWCEYLDIVKCILDKGFDVNQLINMGDGYKTTILNHALRQEDSELAGLILDRNPDVFIFDTIGHSADKLFIYRTTGDSDLDDHINSDNEHMVYLSNKFDKIKHKQLEQKKTNIWKK